MENKPRVCLDLDSTLARTCDVAFELVCGPDHEYSYDDIESWEWGLNEFGTDTYLNSLWHAWTLRGDEIEPFSVNPSGRTTTLYGLSSQLDVVTEHPDHIMGIDEAKQSWLDSQGIAYDNYRSLENSKSTYDYDIYIDDKPSLAAELAFDDTSTLLLYDHTYNRNVQGPCTRINSLKQAIDHVRASIDVYDS